jgi:hypothetical protein
MLRNLFTRAVYGLTGYCFHDTRIGHKQIGDKFVVFTSCRVCERELG